MAEAIVQGELHAFASAALGMNAEELACLTPAQSELLLKTKLACETKDAARYVCSAVNPEAAQRIRDWNIAANSSPPAFYRYVFCNAALGSGPLPESLERFKKNVDIKDNALALRVFHAVNFGCPRAEMLDAADNNRVRANDISNQVDFYREHVEGGNRSVVQEEWAQFLKNGIRFPFFQDNRVILGNVLVNDAAGVVDKNEIEEALEPIDKPIPYDSVDYTPEPINLAQNPLLKAYRQRAGVPLTFSDVTAAKQLVSALISKRVPAYYLHRDQEHEDVSNAVHGLPHLTRDHFAPLIKATVAVNDVRDTPECREYYWQQQRAQAPAAVAEFVADVAWNCVQQKRTLNWVV
jgi:hypothetical protein